MSFLSLCLFGLLNKKWFHECSAASHSLSNLCAFVEGGLFIKKTGHTVIITPHFSTAVGRAGEAAQTEVPTAQRTNDMGIGGVG